MKRSAVDIVGLGPVGSILGAYPVRSGLTVYGVELNDVRAEQVNLDGLVIRGFAELDEKPNRCFNTLAELSGVEDLSVVFICTKTWALDDVMTVFADLEWPEDMRVVAAMRDGKFLSSSASRARGSPPCWTACCAGLSSRPTCIGCTTPSFGRRPTATSVSTSRCGTDCSVPTRPNLRLGRGA